MSSLYHSYSSPAVWFVTLIVDDVVVQFIIVAVGVMVGMAGCALTTTVAVAVHPVPVSVKVKVTLPAPTMVTVLPETVATAVLPLAHVPPVVGDKVMAPVVHTGLGVAETVGGVTALLIVTPLLRVEIQPVVGCTAFTVKIALVLAISDALTVSEEPV